MYFSFRFLRRSDAKFERQSSLPGWSSRRQLATLLSGHQQRDDLPFFQGESCLAAIYSLLRQTTNLFLFWIRGLSAVGIDVDCRSCGTEASMQNPTSFLAQKQMIITIGKIFLDSFEKKVNPIVSQKESCCCCFSSAHLLHKCFS